MITIYGKGFPEKERKTYTSIIYNNIISSAKTLAEQCPTHGPVQGEDAKAAYKKIMEDLNGDEEVDGKLCDVIKCFWQDKGTQATYEKRALYQLTDSAAYFFDKIDEVGRLFCLSV